MVYKKNKIMFYNLFHNLTLPNLLESNIVETENTFDINTTSAFAKLYI